MKKSKNIVYIIVKILICSLIMFNSTTYAIGMAGLDDATADAQATKEEENQQKKQQESIGKSSNNYLSNLTVSGYEITPKFDKQTVNYSIKSTIKDKQINITAKKENDKATITGDGIVTLSNGENNIKVVVKAENEMTRTYFIEVNAEVNSSSDNNANINQESINDVTENVILKNAENQIDNQSNINNKNYKVLVIIIIIILILIILLFKINKSKKNRRH